MLDPKALRLAVALASIRANSTFFWSLGYWDEKAPDPSDEWLNSLFPLTIAQAVAGEGNVLEVTDCHADVRATHGSAVHIYGDLYGRVIARGQCDVVVAGDVMPAGSIHGKGIVNVFVGGMLRGEVVNRGSSCVWISQHLAGTVKTGEPSAHLHVLGDFTGSIVPAKRAAALLYLEVGGFTPFELVERTAAARYTCFEAVLHRSDRPPGFYPDRATRKAMAAKCKHNRWVVLTEETAPPSFDLGGS
jgi:hypothetical protein